MSDNLFAGDVTNEFNDLLTYECIVNQTFMLSEKHSQL